MTTNLPPWGCFYDIETTGTDEQLDGILEIGALLYHFESNTVESQFSQLLATSRFQEERLMGNEVVVQMHTESGLLCDERPRYIPEVVDSKLAHWVEDVTGSSRHVASCGSGVAHFDRRFIALQLPKFHRCMTYWSLDVGVLRRACEFAAPELVYPGTAGKTHRGLDDARFHLAEWRHYRSVLIGALPPVPDDVHA